MDIVRCKASPNAQDGHVYGGPLDLIKKVRKGFKVR